ncbi:MAG: 1-acyl-sn-glycerol-3-phosphate acyltransferase [Actinobacteria bacterium]|nr:1-acyl-sn-glycerol-3-phosphate acyltransferase [Actinomycetota bacterium]
MSRRSRGFPYRAPTWPGAVERPPVERTTGIDYDTSWSRRYSVRLARAAVLDTVGKALVQVVASPRITGVDRLDGVEGPVVFAANHASHVDTPLLLTSLPDRFRHRTVVAAGADYFFDKRWKAALWSFTINAVPIERLRVSPRSVRVTADLVDEGWSVVIFPEGGRSPDGWGQDHRPGPAWLAQRAGVPVVPVHLEGTRRILPRGGGKLRPSSTAVTFGASLRAGDDEDARAFAARIEQAVAELADEQASGWWTARRRAAEGRTPSLTGPAAGAWRRTWALGGGRRRAAKRAWPN